MSTAAARIGPNAITRVAQALERQCGAATTARLFGLAGLGGYLVQPPQQMVDEDEARRLHALLRSQLGDDIAARVAREAGTATANYLLAHRIPRAVQAVLRVLPASLAAGVLLQAITRHAWTFAGSGHFDATTGRPVRLAIRGNPLCRGLRTEAPTCDYYAATFERLFQVLVHRHSRVAETSCEARGDDACRFEVRW